MNGMLLSEKLILNVAERYLLRLSGFDLDRIATFDQVYQELQESVFIHLCSLVEITDFSDKAYAETIVPADKLNTLREKIDTYYCDMDQKARTTFWSILSVMLWEDSHQYLCDIQYEKRFKDPILGEAFKAIDDFCNT